jgi:DNA-binding transcriptional LysR family regulator
MDLRQLEYFQMVAKTSNITRAAEQLHVSQSTVTLAIQKLEDELGVFLFDRSQKQFSLTAEGHAFVQKVSNSLNMLQDGVAEINNYRLLKKGTLKVGVPPMIGSYLFPEILAGFRKYYPQLHLSTVEEGSLNIRQLLKTGDLDLGIINLYQPSPLLETLVIAREPIVACLPLSHPLANNSIISLNDVKDEPFIFFKEGAYNRHIIVEECKKHGFAPNIILSTDQIETMKGLVEKGVGICFLLEGIARKSKSFASIPLTESLYMDIGLVWKKDKYISLAAQAFIDFITDLNLSKPKEASSNKSTT